ncbi:endonuclease domain-containing protein [uncultured Devosia sp.]|uniref:endonuclease domain-containing protein n=1 Tax=uncultured Devosia sp. TaxID=211434 RepID=UPI002609C015|nr:endonuclease domain-containing protein [uncultured Devosia sp.]
MAETVAFARKLRREQTLPERRFWALTLAWRDAGLHWRRQSPIGPYVVDFVCKGKKLVVEIDGDTHFSEAGVTHDAQRTAYLAGRGYRVLRFTNADVMQRGEGVFVSLAEVLGEPDNES